MPDGRRVLFLVHSEYPVGEPRVRRQADAAVAAGWEVTVFALATSGAPTDEQVAGARVVRSRVRRTRDMSARGLVSEYVGFMAAAFGFCTRSPRFDTVVVANPPDFLIAAALPQRMKGARLVLDVHDLMTDLFSNRLGAHEGSAPMRVLSWLERASWRFADAVLTVHGPYAAEIRRRSGGTVCPSVVMNSADPALFQPRGSEPGPPWVAGYHGSVLARYGVTDLVTAFAAVRVIDPDARLVMLGDGDGRDVVAAAAREAGVSDALELSGAMLPVEQVVERIPAFSVGVIPNRPGGLNRFALSTKLFEYVAVGVPAVCAGLETLRAHFSDDEVLFFEPGDVADLADKLAWAHDHPEQMRARAVRARSRYESQYAWGTHKAVFLSVLDGRGARARGGTS